MYGTLLAIQSNRCLFFTWYNQVTLRSMIELIIEYKDGGGKSLKWCSLCHFFLLFRTAPVDFIIVGLSPEIFGETDTSAWVQRNGYCCQLRPVIQGLSQYVWWVQRKFGQIKFNICTCNTKRTFAAGKICLELKIWRAKRSVPVESTTGKFMKIQYTCSRYFLWLKIFAVQTLKGIKLNSAFPISVITLR